MGAVFWLFFLIAFTVLLFLWPAGDDHFAPHECDVMRKIGFTLHWARQRGFYYVLDKDEE